MAKNTSRRDFLKQAVRAGLVVGLTGTGSHCLVGCAGREFDLIIRGGMIYDGLGGEPFPGDVGIKKDKIAAIGDLGQKTAHQMIEGAGLSVTPGFIDAHCHTDISLLVNPRAESIIRQGITTEVSGQCGSSPFPVGGPSLDRRKKNLKEEYDITLDWTDADSFFRKLEKNRTAVNYVPFVGHGAVRTVVMGLEDRDPTFDEMRRMKRVVRECMEQGSFGFSTGLEYTPGSFAKTEEVIELSRVAAEMGGVYATHMRSEDVRVEEALEEAIRIAREAGISLQISHLKASQQRNWHKLPKMLDRIMQASQEGINIHADRYTYTAWATTLQIMLPMWAREGDNDDLVSRLKDNGQWEQIKTFLVDKVDALGSWESVLITQLKKEENRHLQGKTVAQLAVELKKDPLVFVRELLIENEGDVSMVGFGMSEENTEKVLSFPLTMIGTDGDAVAPYGKLSKGNPHPRHYGAFPRYLGYYIRERKILSMPEAIRRITSLPADKFGLKDHGVLAEGKYADVVLFNPETVIDKATFANPHQYPEGIDYVIVNGRIVIEKGEHSGVLPGKVLRKV